MERSAVDSLLRTSQAYCQQVCEKQTLDYGIAFFNPRFAPVSAANQFREVWIDDPCDVPKAFDEADRWFADLGLRCLRWAPAGGRTSEGLSCFLMERGFVRRDYAALMLTSWPGTEVREVVRVLPARAMRAAFRAVAERALASRNERGYVEGVALMEERLDDPPYDMFVALVENEPAGCCALYQVGDIVRVLDFEVLDDAAYDMIGAGLLTHVLGLARRLAMRNVVAQISVDDQRARDLFGRCGFADDGALTEFERAV